VTLEEAGAYAPVGASAGVLAVRNLSTGVVGETSWLGSGLVRGALDNPVPVQAGQSYEISNSGTVMKAEGDSFIQTTFKIGTGKWSNSTAGHGSDMAQLFAQASAAAPPEESPDISPYADKARGQPAKASSIETWWLAPRYAVDGSSSTRWSSEYSDNEWWRVDLGALRKVNKVSINWEVAYASNYRIETSLDGVNYSVAADVLVSSKGRETSEFTTRLARYVRIVAVERATRWGSSFYDCEVFGPSDG
jgi:hypothetical protein